MQVTGETCQASARGQGELRLHLPALSRTFQAATALVRDPKRLELQAVLNMVLRDPLLSIRLLDQANATREAHKRPISNLEQAVYMLGPLTVTGVVLGMNLMSPPIRLQGKAQWLLDQLVRHSLATAFLTRFLYGRAVGDESGANVAFAAGLLHDYGKIVLLYNKPQQAAAAYAAGSGLPVDRRLRERQCFGYCHTHAGDLAATRLHLPGPLHDVIAHHHDLRPADREQAPARLRRMTCAANQAAKAMGFGFPDRSEWKRCLAHPVWRTLLRCDFPMFRQVDSLADVLIQQTASLHAFVHLQSLALAWPKHGSSVGKFL
jgi:HD-like signal output (HDOD) protein